jgi:homoserine kinase
MIEDPATLNARAVFELATEFEGHPDNAAPAVFGRGTIAWMAGTIPRCARFDVKEEVRPLVLVPGRPVSTRVARAVLPERVGHREASVNAGRAALQVHALTAEPALLFDASEDHLHQQYRADVMPDTLALVTYLRARRVPAMVSGAGPAVLVLTVGDRADIVGIVPEDWTVLAPDVAQHGGTVARIAD